MNWLLEMDADRNVYETAKQRDTLYRRCLRSTPQPVRCRRIELAGTRRRRTAVDRHDEAARTSLHQRVVLCR